MTDYAPRSSQDYNSFPYNQHLAMPHYSNGNGLSYLYGNGQIQYQTVSTPCSTYLPSYGSGQETSTAPVYMPTTAGNQYHFPLTSTRVPTLPSQSRAYPTSTHYFPASAHRTSTHHPRLAPPRDHSSMDCTEPQESPNGDTMLSEPVLPPLEGYPDVREFDELMKRSVSSNTCLLMSAADLGVIAMCRTCHPRSRTKH